MPIRIQSTALLLFACLCHSLYSQEFIKFKSGDQVSFREMQRDFNEWKSKNDLSTKKYWKHYKRFEMEMQMHTDGHGEPGDPTEYFQAAIQHAEKKSIEGFQAKNIGVWTPAGPQNLPINYTGYMENGMGRVNCVAFHPTDANTYFVGVAQGGLWKTTDNGVTYVPLTDDLPITRISDICIDPNNPNTIYISVCDFEYIDFGLLQYGRKRNTYFGIGVYKTTDGGINWNPTGLSYQLTDGETSLIREIAIDPTNSNNLVACGVNGMFKSTNAGTSWNTVSDSLFWDMIQDPVTPNTLYAASGWIQNGNIGSAGIYKSTNFGTSWNLLTTGIPPRGSVQRIKLAQSASSPNTIYAAAVDDAGGLYGIYKTTNAGTNWNMQFNSLNLLSYDDGSSGGGQGTYDLGFLVNPTDPNHLFIGGINLWSSTDGGSNFDPCGYWTYQFGASVHADIHSLAHQPLTNKYFLCCDGGIYRTTAIISETWTNVNNGSQWPTVWENVSSGMQITSFYRISSSRSTTNELVGGAQDNATYYYDGTDWYTIFGGDGMDCHLDPSSAGNMIGSSQYGNFYGTNDGGFNSYSVDANFMGENAEWTSPFVADYNNLGTLYAGFENVIKSTDNGSNWFPISSFPPSPSFYNSELSALAVSNSNPNVIYACRRVRYEYGNPGNVFRTTNGGSNWANVTPGLPDTLFYTSVEINNTDANTAYVTMAGFTGGQKVYQTTNGGTNWTNISYDLPNIPVNCVKHITASNDLIVATDIGVYVLYDGTTNWVNMSSGLPNVIISDIEINESGNKIYVGTFGRGIWSTDLDIGVSVENTENTNDAFKLYPSIHSGNFTIETTSDQDFSVDIYDLHGKLVYSKNINHFNTHISLQVASGLYFAKMRMGKKLEVKRFVVQ